MCAWGETLKAATPPSMSPETTIKVKILKVPGPYELSRMKSKSPLRADVLSVLMAQDDAISVSTLERRLNNRNIHSAIYALERLGFIEIRRVLKREASMKKVKCLQVSSLLIHDETKLKLVLDRLGSSSPIRARLFSHVYLKNQENEYPQIKPSLTASQSSHAHLKYLIDRHYLQYIELEAPKKKPDSSENLGKGDESVLEFTDEQKNSYDSICNSLDEGVNCTYLLNGVTGSGKTIIYLNLIKKTLKLNKSVLILVPEISLTPQLIDRFTETFGQKIAVLHSKMNDTERYESWKNIHTGKIKIALGVRSAVFAPLNNLGLIIVDEEHESSYKQDAPAPRYNARDAAVIRGLFENSVVVLGTATPSMESMYNVHIGKYILLKISKRGDGAQLPKITVLDIIENMKKGMMKSSISKYLFDKIKSSMQKGEGSLILQNRRGFSSNLRCVECSYVPECKNCSIKLTYHKTRKQLRCHYCGYSMKVPSKCPDCSSTNFEVIGFGTQRIEEELQNFMAEDGYKPVVTRLDVDTSSQKGNQRRILQNFASGKTDILVGTQMIAKGLDFDRVTTVGVINADLQLYLPDFRASERTFQLLTQVSGRAGRNKSQPGEVIIQTYNPLHPAINFAKTADVEGFFNAELVKRKEANYPPFARFNVIEFYGKDENLVSNYAHTFSTLLPKDTDFAEVLGPLLPALPKQNGMFRRMIIIKNNKSRDKSGSKLRSLLRATLLDFKLNISQQGVMMKIDIDSHSAI
jgi:primosomal protein N' (replication factor Y)